MSILILGSGKTGTTGLYNSIKDAVRDTGDWYFLFEPTQPTPFRALDQYASERPILTKVLIDKAAACGLEPESFDRRILVVRDPRDIVVSRLLFMPLIRKAVRKVGKDELDRFLDAIRKKEADPSSWSVRDLYQLAGDIGLGSAGFGSFNRGLKDIVDIDTSESYFVNRYEDFVDGRLEPLSDYLGVEVVNREAGEGSWLSHITRSKGYGDWRHWFLPADVEYFRPMFRQFMGHFGYTDWDLADTQSLDPDAGSAHIERKLAERAAQVKARYGTPKWTVKSVTNDSDVHALVDMADDGDPVSAQRLALLYQAGHLVHRDAAQARRWARHGAIRGHQPSMLLLADLLGDAGSDADSTDESAGFWRKAAEAEASVHKAGKGGDPVTAVSDARKFQLRAARRRVRQLEKEVEKVRSSTRYQVGDLLVNAASNPRDVLRVPSRLLELYRNRDSR